MKQLLWDKGSNYLLLIVFVLAFPFFTYCSSSCYGKTDFLMQKGCEFK